MGLSLSTKLSLNWLWSAPGCMRAFRVVARPQSMAGWKNPLPIGQSTRGTAPGVGSVSEVGGERYSRGRVKLGAIALPE